MVYYGFAYPQIFNKPPNWDAPWVSQPDRFSFQATSQMIQRLRAAGGLKNHEICRSFPLGNCRTPIDLMDFHSFSVDGDVSLWQPGVNGGYHMRFAAVCARTNIPHVKFQAKKCFCLIWFQFPDLLYQYETVSDTNWNRCQSLRPSLQH